MTIYRNGHNIGRPTKHIFTRQDIARIRTDMANKVSLTKIAASFGPDYSTRQIKNLCLREKIPLRKRQRANVSTAERVSVRVLPDIFHVLKTQADAQDIPVSTYCALVLDAHLQTLAQAQQNE